MTTLQNCSYDPITRTMVMVDCTPEEIADIEARKAAAAAEQSARLIASYTDAVQARLDAFARARGYDSILSACTYATSTVPRFAADAARAVSLRDETWDTCYQILAEVEAGQRPVPTLAELIAELPALTWPA